MKTALQVALLSTALVFTAQAKNSVNPRVIKSITPDAAYAIVDLTSGIGHDTGALTVRVLAQEVEGVTSTSQYQWKRLDEQTESVLARGVYTQRKDKKGFVDTLSYAAWDMAGAAKVKHLHLFYFMPEQKVSLRSKTNPAILGGGYATDSSATLQLTYVLIDMAKNRAVVKEVCVTSDTDSKGFMRENETAVAALCRKLFERLGLAGGAAK